MKTVLYIHGFCGKPKGGTFEGLQNFFSQKINGEKFHVISFPFPELHTDFTGTQKQIEKYIEENNVDILAGASLGGFYTLACKQPVLKIAINPCMEPSKEIILLKYRETGLPVEIDETVLNDWKEAETYNLSGIFKNAFGIFGKQDPTFHYDENHNFKPLFEKLFPSSKDLANTKMVEGVHSLEPEQLSEGLEAAVKYFFE